MTSSGVEPWMSNYFSKKLKQGVVGIKNKYLDKLILDFSKGSIKVEEEQWAIVRRDLGSVKNLSWMSDDQKDVFKTAYEIDQRAIVELAADRQKFIDQSQSINLFFTPDAHVSYIYNVHWQAWELGLKSLYYQRGMAEDRASTASTDRKQIIINDIEGTECLSCQ
jgi:ribonucleoside-diphosphate reductase alpha chain